MEQEFHVEGRSSKVINEMRKVYINEDKMKLSYIFEKLEKKI